MIRQDHLQSILLMLLYYFDGIVAFPVILISFLYPTFWLPPLIQTLRGDSKMSILADYESNSIVPSNVELAYNSMLYF